MCLIRKKKLSDLIDTTFSKVNRLFVQLSENEDARFSDSKYYKPQVEINVIKEYHVLIEDNFFSHCNNKKKKH